MSMKLFKMHVLSEHFYPIFSVHSSGKSQCVGPPLGYTFKDVRESKRMGDLRIVLEERQHE